MIKGIEGLKKILAGEAPFSYEKFVADNPERYIQFGKVEFDNLKVYRCRVLNAGENHTRKETFSYPSGLASYTGRAHKEGSEPLFYGANDLIGAIVEAILTQSATDRPTKYFHVGEWIAKGKQHFWATDINQKALPYQPLPDTFNQAEYKEYFSLVESCYTNKGKYDFSAEFSDAMFKHFPQLQMIIYLSVAMKNKFRNLAIKRSCIDSSFELVRVFLLEVPENVLDYDLTLHLPYFLHSIGTCNNATGTLEWKLATEDDEAAFKLGFP